MQKIDPLIRTKLHLPSIRSNLVLRPRLQQQIMQGLRGPLTLIVAPAGFGKTTLASASIANCGMPVAWLSLDRDDNQIGRFLTYLIAALTEAEETIVPGSAQLIAGMEQLSPEVVLTTLINNLDSAKMEIVLVFDDYQFIQNEAVHEAMVFLLEHCPINLHVIILTRSDPPIPIHRLRARGQTVELRLAELRFNEPEAFQFLNESMGLQLDSGSVAVLKERTEGWIAGLQMAALSMRDREDVLEFIKGFSGTNRYILDYLLEEVLAGQSPEVQHFLLLTSILERLSAPLCDALFKNETAEPSFILHAEHSSTILEYLERANLFLVPLDDERQWYRCHHLFADLLRARLDQIYPRLAPQLHARAAAWHEQNGSILEAIHHASIVPDDEMVERLIKQNYLEMMNCGEMSWVRFWMGNLSKELVYRRPWLCLYEAMNRSWFGQLEEANLFLNEAEKRLRAEGAATGAQSMLGYHAYVKSRVTAMQGDTGRAIEFCLTAREHVPADSLDLQIDFGITLGYEYFLYGDFGTANKILNETIQSGYIARAINNPVAAYCLLARSQVYEGRLHEADDLLHKAAQLIHEPGGEYLGVVGLIEVETATLLYEWNDVETALIRLKRGLDYLRWWGKTDDFCLAYITLSRIQLAQGNRADASGAIEKAAQLIQTCGVFSEARSAVETAQVKMWLLQEDWLAVDRWMAAVEHRLESHDPFRYEDELTRITQARVFIAQRKLGEAIRLLSCLEEFARSEGRQGRLIEIMILKALVLQQTGNKAQANSTLTEILTLAEPSGYVRIFLNGGETMKMLISQWLAHAGVSPLRNYAASLISQFDDKPQDATVAPIKSAPGSALIEPLTPRELEVLNLLSAGLSNRQIAKKLFLAEGTVKFYMHAILQKLGVNSRTQALVIARERNLL